MTMDQSVFEQLEADTIGKIVHALEAHRNETGIGYKSKGQGGFTLHTQLVDENQQPYGRSVVHHANGHGYCQRVVVFNTPAEGEKPASTVTRHYHHKHQLAVKVFAGPMKATPTDCDIENIGIDVANFLKSGILPTTLKLG